MKKKVFLVSCPLRDIEERGSITLPPKRLMREIKDEINSSDIVVIDASQSSSNLTGIAFAKGIPILTIVKREDNIPDELQEISKKVFFYDKFDDLKKFFTQIGSTDI